MNRNVRRKPADNAAIILISRVKCVVAFKREKPLSSILSTRTAAIKADRSPSADDGTEFPSRRREPWKTCRSRTCKRQRLSFICSLQPGGGRRSGRGAGK